MTHIVDWALRDLDVAERCDRGEAGSGAVGRGNAKRVVDLLCCRIPRPALLHRPFTPPDKIAFSSFKASFTTNVNYLKRR